MKLKDLMELMGISEEELKKLLKEEKEIIVNLTEKDKKNGELVIR